MYAKSFEKAENPLLKNQDLKDQNLKEKFGLIKEVSLIFLNQNMYNGANSYFIKFIRDIFLTFLRKKPYQYLFWFSSLFSSEGEIYEMIPKKFNGNINDSNANKNDKPQKKSVVIEEQSIINMNNCKYIIKKTANHPINEIYTNLKNSFLEDISNNINLLNNLTDSNSNNILKANNSNNLKGNNNKNKSYNLIHLNTTVTNSNLSNNNSFPPEVNFEKSLKSIYNLELALIQIRRLIDNMQSNLKKIQSLIDEINNYLKQKDVCIPIPKHDNFLLEPNKMAYIKRIHKFSPSDVFKSKDKPIKITFYDQNDQEYIYIYKIADDIYKEYKSSQIFLSIQSLLNFPENKINEEIKSNFKCYEITTLGDNIILIEFLKEIYPLKTIIDLQADQYRLNKIDLIYQYWNTSDDKKLYFYKNFPKILIQDYLYTEFPDPIQWYRKKKNFSISNAIWSMAGYILRLNDRHLQNILINKDCQVIHIDYGYILNDGLTLPVPEICPVRFTGNIRFGLGFFEEMGIFFNTCCKVLKTIYKHSYVVIPQIKNILDVFKETLEDEIGKALKEINNFDTTKNSRIRKYFKIKIIIDKKFLTIF